MTSVIPVQYALPTELWSLLGAGQERVQFIPLVWRMKRCVYDTNHICDTLADRQVTSHGHHHKWIKLLVRATGKCISSHPALIHLLLVFCQREENYITFSVQYLLWGFPKLVHKVEISERVGHKELHNVHMTKLACKMERSFTALCNKKTC